MLPPRYAVIACACESPPFLTTKKSSDTPGRLIPCFLVVDDMDLLWRIVATNIESDLGGGDVTADDDGDKLGLTCATLLTAVRWQKNAWAATTDRRK